MTNDKWCIFNIKIKFASLDSNMTNDKWHVSEKIPKESCISLQATTFDISF